MTNRPLYPTDKLLTAAMTNGGERFCNIYKDGPGYPTSYRGVFAKPIYRLRIKFKRPR